MTKFNRFDDDHMKTPLFFKIWFAMIFTLVITVFMFVGYIFYSAITADSLGKELGQFAGEISQGYNEAVEPKE